MSSTEISLTERMFSLEYPTTLISKAKGCEAAGDNTASTDQLGVSGPSRLTLQTKRHLVLPQECRQTPPPKKNKKGTCVNSPATIIPPSPPPPSKRFRTRRGAEREPQESCCMQVMDIFKAELKSELAPIIDRLTKKEVELDEIHRHQILPRSNAEIRHTDTLFHWNKYNFFTYIMHWSLNNPRNFEWPLGRCHR